MRLTVWTRRFLILAIVGAALLRCGSVEAYEYPSVERGFKPERAFHIGDIDDIRLFNGGLELSIAIGQRYSVGGGFSYGLTLSYSSQPWDYVQNVIVPPGAEPYTQAWPVRGTNAGLGWRLSLGEFWDGTVIGVGTCSFCYVSPDGAKHRFYQTLHPDLPDDGLATMYTRDGTYLRLRQIAGGWEIDFPSGEIHKFDTSGRLVQMRDRFSNRVDVVYGSNSWTITDTQGRSHVVNLVTVPYYGKAVGSVVLAAFGDTQATYTFTYVQVNLRRSCLDTDPETSATVLLPLLTSVGLPDGDGGSYSMPVSDYDQGIPGQCDPGSQAVPREGLLRAVTLPTRGRIEWAYLPYNFPAPLEGEDPDEDPPWLQNTAGVSQRTLRDAYGTVEGTWTYTQVLPGGQQAQESITQVSTPLGDRTDHYFRVGDDPDPAYGLPFSPLESAPGRPDLLRSTKVYDCNASGGDCQHLRTTFLKYRTDSPFAGGPEFNARIEASSTIFHDDGNRHATTDRSSFDGLGHYRTETLSGSFDSGNARTSVTNFNPTRNTYPGSFIMVAPGEPWVLDTFDYRQVTENGQTAREDLCFEAANGHLLRKRVLKTGVTHGAADLVTVFTRDGAGNTTREQRYGSDLGSVGAGALCSIGLGTEQSRMDHTYEYGSLATSRYVQANGAAVSFFSLNRTIDRNTGLPSSAREAALVATTYGYDGVGRLTSEDTGSDARTTYTYNLGQGTGFANVKIRRIQNGGSAVLAEEQLVFDHFGRPIIAKRLQASGTWSKRRTFYNALGWTTDVAEWEPDGQNHTAFTKYRDFDPFGRARRIEPPDGAAHEIGLGYFGARVVSRTVRVATALNGVETTATTTERYDRQGRLHQVVEPSGAAGANVTTTYGYDEAGRLSSVNQGSSQVRTFNYDNRSLLTSECHPEKGLSGNGCVTYSLYNAWGQPGRTDDGPNDLRRLYDRAGRPTEIKEFGGQQRTLKAWTYGTGIGAADRSNGKIKTADRYNYVFLGPTAYTVLVRETYTYGGRSGRVSTRLTDSTINPTGGPPTDSFTQSFVWTDLGDPFSLGYPHRTNLPAGPTVGFTYTHGYLTAVPGYASAITYHSNGMLDQVVHTNSVTDVWGQDPNKMQRPASIAAWYQFGAPSAVQRFTTGAYGYDGSGNVETIGANGDFVYDKVSRLVEGRLPLGVLSGGTPVTQTHAFDAYGNMTSITTNGVTRNTPTSASTNRLTSGAYDAAGNLTGYNGAVYQYGPFNDMWRTKNGAEEAIYLYTADDERLWEFNFNGKNRWTLRDLGGKVLREYSYDRGTTVWTVERDYVYRDGILLAAQTPQGVRHFSVDHLGTPRLVTNGAGAQVAYHVYYPFGEEATTFNQDAERMKFTGHERDFHSAAGAADDLDYMHARFCSPVTGRFLVVDPATLRRPTHQPQEWNRYAYVLDNPLAYNDPDGLRQNPVTGLRGVAPPSRGSFGAIRSHPSNPSIGRFGHTRKNADGSPKLHPGLDINAAKGTPVAAAETGIVTNVHPSAGSAGKRLDIKTADGQTLIYAHLDSFSDGLKVGDKVEEGTTVGEAGTTGNAATDDPTQEHLHFAVLDSDGTRVDPEVWLNDPEAPPPSYPEGCTPAAPDRPPGVCAGRK